MAGNITEEQFKKFCKDFVEKYEGRNFQELVKSLGGDYDVCYTRNVNKTLTIMPYYYGITLSVNNDLRPALFGYIKQLYCVFISIHGKPTDVFFTIEDLYKFFKMNEKETTEPSNTTKVTFNIPIETIKDDYIELLSKKHNLNKESIELKIIM